MPGKDYSEQAYQIRKQFEDLINSSKDTWKDEQAARFGYDHAEPIQKALTDMELPIENIVDLVETKLKEIQSYANGR